MYTIYNFINLFTLRILLGKDAARSKCITKQEQFFNDRMDVICEPLNVVVEKATI